MSGNIYLMDHYSTLGVAKTATPDEIKKAYRKLASQHHPDKGGDTATFQKIEEAYRTLSDPNKKQQYDNPHSGGFPGGFQFHSNGFNFDDIISQVFNMKQGQTTNQRTQVFRTSVIVTLDEVYRGSTHTLKVNTPYGPKVINIDIPKGLREGTQMRYDNVIDNASLLVEFRTSPHLKFERRQDDLAANHPISVLDLIAGTTFEFTTISGRVFEVKVPQKTQPYMQLKIAGQGMPIPNTGQYGDQIILLKPYMPDIIDDTIIESIVRNRIN